MPSPVYKREPDPEKLLALSTDEIALYLFEYLYALGTDPFSRRNLFLNDQAAIDYPQQYRKKVAVKLMEALQLLERLNIIIQSPTSEEGWYTFSTAARQLGTAEALRKYIDDQFSEPATRYAKFNQELTSKLEQYEKQLAVKTQEALGLIEAREHAAKEQ